MNLTLSKEQERELSFFAKKQNMSEESLLLAALDEYLEDLKDLELALEAKAKIDKTFLWQDVKKEL